MEEDQNDFVRFGPTQVASFWEGCTPSATFSATACKKDNLMEDQISVLPDELVCTILSLLTMKEAARTSVLSRRWENLWKYFTSSLDFDGSKIMDRMAEDMKSMPLATERTKGFLSARDARTAPGFYDQSVLCLNYLIDASPFLYKLVFKEAEEFAGWRGGKPREEGRNRGLECLKVLEIVGGLGIQVTLSWL
ncbi:hypothetical protein Vadar_005288 [Vaccinium darrowii]|uniref:Uncharacterized protein n=1 Tax=Vaccinium darrowii TaxID=229202 RepID=A0ACB7ZHK4_9ERIC|nr:hypothetical protein Vadar_005288 [Vaccinium darrowii]